MPSSFLVGPLGAAAALPNGANRQGLGVAVEAILIQNLCINTAWRKKVGRTVKVGVCCQGPGRMVKHT